MPSDYEIGRMRGRLEMLEQLQNIVTGELRPAIEPLQGALAQVALKEQVRIITTTFSQLLTRLQLLSEHTLNDIGGFLKEVQHD
mgnify:FL=1